MERAAQGSAQCRNGIHLGGGGDLSQSGPILLREPLISNALMTAGEVTAMKANLVAFYSTLKFP